MRTTDRRNMPLLLRQSRPSAGRSDEPLAGLLKEVEKTLRDDAAILPRAEDDDWALAGLVPAGGVEVEAVVADVVGELHQVARPGVGGDLVHHHHVAPEPVAREAEDVVGVQAPRPELPQAGPVTPWELHPQLLLGRRDLVFGGRPGTLKQGAGLVHNH